MHINYDQCNILYPMMYLTVIQKINFYSIKDETSVILCWFPTMWHLFIYYYIFKAIHNELNFIKSSIRIALYKLYTFFWNSKHNYYVTLLLLWHGSYMHQHSLLPFFFIDYKLLLNLLVFSSYNSTELNINNVG